MYFCVDYDNLSKTARSLKSKTYELDSLYTDILKMCNEVNENWVSEDSTVYLGRMESFLNDTLDRNEVIHKCANSLNKISYMYNVQDNKWANDLLKSELMKKRDEIK